MENRSLLNVLDDLIETCKDREYGYETCAKHVESVHLREQMLARAGEGRQAAEALTALASEYGDTREPGGSTGGALHRGWVAVRGSLSGDGDQAMLNECERGEDMALARYRKALESPVLVPPVRSVVELQFADLQRSHDQIRALRDGLATRS